jgi:hypothetical protein
LVRGFAPRCAGPDDDNADQVSVQGVRKPIQKFRFTHYPRVW